MRCRWFVWSRPLVALTLAVAGCGSGTTATEPTDGTTTVTTTTDGAGDTGTASSVGLANPASQYCVAQGGEVLIVTAADGSQSGRCRLPDGTEVDEWEYFRASQVSTVEVYLQAADIGANCDQVVAVSRSAAGADTPGDTLTQLLAGPTAAEEAQGLHSWFSAGTAGMLRSVSIEGGVARVDFDPALRSAIPNASASCGSALLLAQLDATIGQFEGVDRAVYSFDGDVDAFYQWLQMVSPAP